MPPGRSLSAPVCWNPAMSAPAENARSPFPRRTTTRVSSPSSSSSSRQSVSTIAAFTAFTGGLSSQTVLIREPSVTLPSHLRHASVSVPGTGHGPTDTAFWRGVTFWRASRDASVAVPGTGRACNGPGTPGPVRNGLRTGLDGGRGLGDRVRLRVRLPCEALAQVDLAELAHARLRDLVDELDPVGQPPLRERRREEVAQLVGRRRMPLPEHDRGQRPL